MSAKQKRYIKQTFSLHADLVENLKTAAWYYRMQQTEIVEKALTQYFKRLLRLPSIRRPKEAHAQGTLTRGGRRTAQG
jgi:hypothetical protein